MNDPAFKARVRASYVTYCKQSQDGDFSFVRSACEKLGSPIHDTQGGKRKLVMTVAQLDRIVCHTAAMAEHITLAHAQDKADELTAEKETPDEP